MDRQVPSFSRAFADPGIVAAVGTWDDWTDASYNADKGLAIVDGLMQFASDKRGNQSKKEQPLYMSSVAFTYAVWENYIEEAAIELVTALARDIKAEQLTRPQVREFIEKDASVWDLSVHPGWKQLWITRVTELAKGGEGSGWGLNTANARNTRKLFAALGIDPLPAEHSDRLDQLVSLRGEIVHTATTTSGIYKREVGEWQEFIRQLYEAVDEAARQQCTNWLTG